MHASRRATIFNSFLAGNGYGIEMNWCDEVAIVDTEIRGISTTMKSMISPPYYNKPCVTTNNFVVPMGYRMHTAIYWFDRVFSDGSSASNRGARLDNVKFFDFDHDDECSNSVPIGFNTRDKRDGHWNYVSSFNNVQFESANMIDAKSASDGGVNDIVIVDLGGNSDPSDQSITTSAFVSDRPHLTSFASKCTSYPKNLAYCENSCLRTVTLSIDQTGTRFFDLKVYRESDGMMVFGTDFYNYDDNPQQYTFEENERKFSIPLPKGSYRFEFFNEDEIAWPKHVYELWGKY